MAEMKPLGLTGWFPSHQVFFEDDRVSGLVSAVGFEARAGVLQEYLVDKKQPRHRA
jgi:hypothetical protein